MQSIKPFLRWKSVPTRFRTDFRLNFDPFSEFLEYRSVEYCSSRVIAKLPVLVVSRTNITTHLKFIGTSSSLLPHLHSLHSAWYSTIRSPQQLCPSLSLLSTGLCVKYLITRSRMNPYFSSILIWVSFSLFYLESLNKMKSQMSFVFHYF